MASQEDALHGAAQLAYDPETLRDRCWPKLGANTQNELRGCAGGDIIEWWAGLTPQDRLPLGVVLGPSALCHAEPFRKESGGHAHRMKSFRFAPESLSSVSWNNGADARHGGAVEDSRKPRLADSLDSAFTGFLGNLPGEAQRLLQKPFAPGPGLTYAYHFEKIPSHTETQWKFWCYLLDDRVVAFESGVSVTFNTGAVRWDVVCYTATRSRLQGSLATPRTAT
jgi:hypothetical protein